MVGLKTGMPRCASGSSSGSSHGLASEFGEGRCAPSEPKKWSGWTVIAGTGGVTDLVGVREEVRLLDIAGGLLSHGGKTATEESDNDENGGQGFVVVVVVVGDGDGDGDGERECAIVTL